MRQNPEFLRTNDDGSENKDKEVTTTKKEGIS